MSPTNDPPPGHADGVSAPTPPSRASGGTPVLYLDTPHVELGWRRQGRMAFESTTVAQGDNESLVGAACELLRRARLRRSDIVVVLSASFFDSRQVLLGRVPDDEAYAVLARKSANAIGTDLAECLFWARRCEAPLRDAEVTQATWLVYTRRRSEHFDLLLRLRKAGIRVRRTVAGREVLTHLVGDDVDPALGNILVSSTGRSVYAHLFRGRDLVQESRLPLPDFEGRADAYASIVQDVRQLAAFWSKGSRGAPMQAVHLFGFSQQEIDKMRTPLEIATQVASTRIVGRPASESYRDVRSDLLRAFMDHASKASDLSLPLPLRPSRVAAATLAISLVAGGIAWKLLQHWAVRIDERTAEIHAELEGTDRVESDGAARADYLTARSTLLASIENLGKLPRRGIPLDQALEHVIGTLGRVVEVRHLALQDTDEGTRVILEASLADDLESAARRLEWLRRALAVDPRFASVSIQPSSHVPDRARGEVLTFTLTGVFLGRGA